MDNETIKYRIEELETDVQELKVDVKEILRNHLPHIMSELVGIKVRLTIFSVIILGAIGTLIGFYINSSLP